MKYGLESQIIDQICLVLSTFPAIQKALLYGSRAKGNYKKGSDIDICLVGAFDMTFLYTVQEALEDLNLPYIVDLSSYHALENPELINHIDRVGIIIYEKN